MEDKTLIRLKKIFTRKLKKYTSFTPVVEPYSSEPSFSVSKSYLESNIYIANISIDSVTFEIKEYGADTGLSYLTISNNTKDSKIDLYFTDWDRDYTHNYSYDINNLTPKEITTVLNKSIDELLSFCSGYLRVLDANMGIIPNLKFKTPWLDKYFTILDTELSNILTGYNRIELEDSVTYCTNTISFELSFSYITEKVSLKVIETSWGNEDVEIKYTNLLRVDSNFYLNVLNTKIYNDYVSVLHSNTLVSELDVNQGDTKLKLTVNNILEEIDKLNLD